MGADAAGGRVVTELEWWDGEPDPTAVEREPRKCRRHEWTTKTTTVEGLAVTETRCRRCAKLIDADARRRGRSSLRAGKDAERAIAKSYGGTRTGQFGGPDDVVVGELFVVQSKAGGWFSERVWAELVKLPRTGGRVPTLVISDRPGPGHRTRRYVVRSLEDDLDLHGPTRRDDEEGTR